MSSIGMIRREPDIEVIGSPKASVTVGRPGEEPLHWQVLTVWSLGSVELAEGTRQVVHVGVGQALTAGGDDDEQGEQGEDGQARHGAKKRHGATLGTSAGGVNKPPLGARSGMLPPCPAPPPPRCS